MNAHDAIAARRTPIRLVIFDCDGVLIDSEPIANRIIAESLTELGWAMDAAESQIRFLGMSLTSMVPIIETHLGRALPHGWSYALADRLLAVLAADAPLIPGAIEALRATTVLGLPWRIASNSSPAEMAAKFARNAMTDLVAGRTHSARDVARGKPAPDLFLAAAAAERVDPAHCLVIEDSSPGVRGAIAAGMDCLAHAPHDDGAILAALGASPFHAMADIPALLRLALLKQPA